MARRFIPWGNDAHGLVCDFLPWHSNAKLACCGMVFRDALISYVNTNNQVWWGQGQSTSSDVETLVSSLKKFRKELSPSCRPNMAMFMIDSQVLWTTTARDLCTRLHSANLVPLECPIVLVESDSGVCGAGVSGEWNFTVYEDRDVELDPAPPVTAVLIVAYIPPEPQLETWDTNGGVVKPRVSCFLVNDHPHDRRYRFSMSVDASDSVFVECVPPPFTPRAFRTGTTGNRAVSRAATIPCRRASLTRPSVPANRMTPIPSQRRLELASAVAEEGFGASLDPAHGVQSGHKGMAPEGARGHRSTEASVEAAEASVQALRKLVPARAAASRRTRNELLPASWRTRNELLPPSTNVPLEGADTILLVGSHPNLLEKTTESLRRLLPRAVVLGGVSGCSLVIADRVFPSDLNRQTQSHGQAPRLVGIALRGVHAMALSSKGFEGLGPVFRVQNAAQSEQEAPQAQPGKFLRDVMVVAEAGGVVSSRPSTAVDILHSQILQDPGWAANDFREVYLGVGSSIDELLNLRNTPGTSKDRGESTGEAHGIPPITVVSDRGQALGLDKEVSPGQFARFMHSTPALSLVDTTVTYGYCKQRLEQLGGDVLGSIRFACPLRAEHVEVSNEQRQPQRQHAQGGEEPENFVTLLNQQETVQFCKILNAPSAGVFCNGELGPLPRLVCGIQPRTAEVRLQSFTACSAVLCWSPHVEL